MIIMMHCIETRGSTAVALAASPVDDRRMTALVRDTSAEASFQRQGPHNKRAVARPRIANEAHRRDG